MSKTLKENESWRSAAAHSWRKGRLLLLSDIIVLGSGPTTLPVAALSDGSVRATGVSGRGAAAHCNGACVFGGGRAGGSTGREGTVVRVINAERKLDRQSVFA